jgi:rhodanese-related sulfurtransferase
MTPTYFKTSFGAALLLGTTLVTGWLSQHLSPDPLPPTHSRGLALLAQFEASGFPLLSTEDTRAFFQAGTHLFLDARPLAEHFEGHIPGTFPVPVNEFDIHFTEIAPILDADSPLIVYCGNPACDQALRLAKRLRDAGYTNVSLFPGGYEAWSGQSATGSGL